METWLPYVNQAFIVVSAIVMAFGWAAIRRGKKETHKRLMLTSVVLAACFFISYVLKTAVVGDTTFGGPKGIRPFYYTFLQIHSILATVAAIMGVITLVYAYRELFGKHRKIGPWTAIIWFITAITGVTVFLLLYIIFPTGEPANILHAWLGH
jgi:putative membrane protein